MFNNDPPSADEEVARLRLVLRNTPLSTLEEYGLVTLDQDENIVRKGPQFHAITSSRELSDDRDGELPHEYL